jgi:uncharacterized protein (DUF983 family)
MIPATEERSVWLGLRRGLAGKCPSCGQSKMFASYLKVLPKCGNCGHALDQYKADDGPAYFTILIVGHAMVAPLLFLEAVRTWPLAWVTTIMVTSVLGATLTLLPLVKGAFVGVQWAVRDRGGV